MKCMQAWREGTPPTLSWFWEDPFSNLVAMLDWELIVIRNGSYLLLLWLATRREGLNLKWWFLAYGWNCANHWWHQCHFIICERKCNPTFSPPVGLRFYVAVAIIPTFSSIPSCRWKAVTQTSHLCVGDGGHIVMQICWWLPQRRKWVYLSIFTVKGVVEALKVL